MIRNMQIRGEILQRIVNRWWGVNWDLGVYGGINLTRRVKLVDQLTYLDENFQPVEAIPYDETVITRFTGCKAMNRFEYGLTTRISYSIANMINVGVYGQYRLSDIITKQDFLIGDPAHQPSPWSIGIEFEIAP